MLRLLGCALAAAMLLGSIAKPLTAQAVTLKTFTGCTETQKTKINDAYTAAATPLQKTVAYVNGLPGKGETAPFTTWFGHMDNRTEAARIFNGVQTIYSNSTDMTVFCPGQTAVETVGGYSWSACGTSTYASSRKDVMVLKVCPNFFNLSKDGAIDSQAGSIIHEFTHVYADTEDHEYGCKDTRALPKEKSVENADSYEYLVETFAMGATCPP